jgi:hypothetical protein
MALLDRNPAVSTPSHEPTVTRGAVIPALLSHTSVDAALTAAMSLEITSFAPFELVVVGNTTVGVVTSNGVRTSIGRAGLDHPLLYTSSSLGDACVEGPRRRLFERLVVGDRGSLLRGQTRFHAHQWTHSPETSVLMSRLDAATVSRTVIDVTRGEVAIAYDDFVAPVRGEKRVVTWESGLY